MDTPNQVNRLDRLELHFTLALDGCSGILQGHTEVVIASHLHTQHIEIGIGRFDRGSFLTIEERHLDQR